MSESFANTSSWYKYCQYTHYLEGSGSDKLSQMLKSFDGVWKMAMALLTGLSRNLHGRFSAGTWPSTSISALSLSDHVTSTFFLLFKNLLTHS